MTFLRHALKSLPEELHAEVKARVGMDSDTNADRVTSTKFGGYASSSTAGMAVSAVTAAAGQLVGGVLGKRASKAAVAVTGVLGGLVRELVERCLFSIPHERGFLLENVKRDGSPEEGCDLSGDGEDEVRSFVEKEKRRKGGCVPVPVRVRYLWFLYCALRYLYVLLPARFRPWYCSKDGCIIVQRPPLIPA